jgi:homoserine dehydrogenase
MQASKFALVGVGNVGRRFLQMVAQKETTLRDRLGMQLTPVAAVDSSGAAINEDGLNIAELLRLKTSGRGVAAYPGSGHSGLSALEALQHSKADLLVEASPVNLRDGEPGLSNITWAVSHGLDVVTANKAPLVLAYRRLTALAAEMNRTLLFSATVAGGLPTVNIGRRDLIAAKMLRVEGVFNSTTNYILVQMAEEGVSLEDALAEAQRAGVAEADPSLDIDGWDAANKLVIVANSVLGMPATLQDVSVQGIRGLNRADLLRATQAGRAIKLLATAEPAGDAYRLAVRPTELPLEHPLARLAKWHMGVVYTTDINGTITAIIREEGPTATSGAVLRDVVHAVSMRHGTRV